MAIGQIGRIGRGPDPHYRGVRVPPTGTVFAVSDTDGAYFTDEDGVLWVEET